jgi:hypothetical protein
VRTEYTSWKRRSDLSKTTGFLARYHVIERMPQALEHGTILRTARFLVIPTPIPDIPQNEK